MLVGSPGAITERALSPMHKELERGWKSFWWVTRFDCESLEKLGK